MIIFRMCFVELRIEPVAAEAALGPLAGEVLTKVVHGFLGGSHLSSAEATVRSISAATSSLVWCVSNCYVCPRCATEIQSPACWSSALGHVFGSYGRRCSDTHVTNEGRKRRQNWG